MEFQIIAGELCLDFINTLDNRPTPKQRKELLCLYRDFADWALEAKAIDAEQHDRLLRAAGMDIEHAANVLRQAILLRECLYRVFSSILSKRQPASADMLTLNTFIAETFSHLQLEPARLRLEWEDCGLRLESLLWPIVRSAADLLTSRDLRYVRECGIATCRWFFIDRSKNHSRRWCDMKVCGNRTKARKFYRRQRRAVRTHKSPAGKV
jgi:predicted RNA-binding Zn ribbon-like protein